MPVCRQRGVGGVQVYPIANRQALGSPPQTFVGCHRQVTVATVEDPARDLAEGHGLTAHLCLADWHRRVQRRHGQGGVVGGHCSRRHAEHQNAQADPAVAQRGLHGRVASSPGVVPLALDSKSTPRCSLPAGGIGASTGVCWRRFTSSMTLLVQEPSAKSARCSSPSRRSTNRLLPSPALRFESTTRRLPAGSVVASTFRTWVIARRPHRLYLPFSSLVRLVPSSKYNRTPGMPGSPWS